MFDFGIASYRPAWLQGRPNIEAAHGQRLAALPGRRLRAAGLAEWRASPGDVANGSIADRIRWARHGSW